MACARTWTTEARQAVQACLKDSASQAMRTLAFGYAVLPPETPADEDALHARRDALESEPCLRRLRRHPRSAARRCQRRRRRSVAGPASK